MISFHIEKSDLIFHKSSEFVINRLKLYPIIRQKTLFLLSGGSAVNLYKDITKFIDESDLDFSFLAFAQIDERFQPEIEEVINAYQIEKTGLWKACDKKRIPYYFISQSGSLQKSAEEYNNILEKLFQEYTYKIAILGLGEDGHTAGLLPGFQKLWDIDKLVVGYENEGEFKRRISMTPQALKQMDQAIVVVSGEKKKGMLRYIVNKMNNPIFSHSEEINHIPVAILSKIPKVDLFSDVDVLK